MSGVTMPEALFDQGLLLFPLKLVGVLNLVCVGGIGFQCPAVR